MRSLPDGGEELLAEAIRRIGRPGFEAAMDRLLRRMVKQDNLIILAFREGGPPLVLYQQSDQPQVFSGLETRYLAGAYRLDPFHDLHLRRVPAGLYRLRDVAPDAFQRSRYFQEYYQQTTLLDELTIVAYPAVGVTLNLCLGRDGSSGQAFTAREQEAAARLAPVVMALAEAHWAGIAAAEVVEGEVGAQVIRAMASAHGIALSPRQAEVALLILRGHSTASIGLCLGVSPQTVKVFRRQLYARCGISSQAELFALMLPLLTAA